MTSKKEKEKELLMEAIQLAESYYKNTREPHNVIVEDAYKIEDKNKTSLEMRFFGVGSSYVECEIYSEAHNLSFSIPIVNTYGVNNLGDILHGFINTAKRDISESNHKKNSETNEPLNEVDLCAADNRTPDHYKLNNKQVLDVMLDTYGKDAVINFLELSAFKYRLRAGKKLYDGLDQKQSAMKDVSKAIHCEEVAEGIKNK
jgi:hypothetical protein